MKKVFFTLPLILLSVTIFAQSGPPDGEANVGDFYGHKVSSQGLKKAMTTDNLIKELLIKNKITNVSVKGTVTSVCLKKGCWINLTTTSGEKFFIKMKDYAFFVPKALEGKTIVLEGDAESKITSVKELQHYAEDAKKPQSEIDAIREPKKEVRFLAHAIQVVDVLQ